jgi:hypothetical protein
MKKVLLIIIIVFAGLSLSGQTGTGWAQQRAKVNFKDSINFASGLKISGVVQTPANWNTAYTDRLKWDGGDASLVAGTGRTSLGGTTVGQAYFTLTNPSAITFPRMNADNTITALSAANFATAIGAGHVYADTMIVNAGVLRIKATTITTEPYSVQIFASSGLDITHAVKDSVALNAGVYKLYVYSVDALTGAKIKILY